MYLKNLHKNLHKKIDEMELAHNHEHLQYEFNKKQLLESNRCSIPYNCYYYISDYYYYHFHFMVQNFIKTKGKLNQIT